MAKTMQVCIRVDESLADQADTLAERMAESADMRALRVSRAAVLRMAMLRGMEALEVEYPPAKPKRRRKAG